MNTLEGLLLLMRPINSFMIGLGVLVGYVAAARGLQNLMSSEPFLGFFTGFFVSSFSMTVNDIRDVNVDILNQPSRPIPCGSVSINIAKRWAGVLLIMGLLSSIPTGIYTFMYAILFALLAWLYSDRLKKHGLLGNMVVAASVAAPFPYGGLLMNAITDTYIQLLTLTAFISALGREVVKGIPDVKGDKDSGFQTVAVRYGESVAGMLAAASFVLASFVSLIPVLVGLSGPLYLPAVLPPATLHVYLAIRIAQNSTPIEAMKVKRLALPAMSLGLLAFILGSPGRP